MGKWEAYAGVAAKVPYIAGDRTGRSISLTELEIDRARDRC
jgi:hypothetical protein